MYTRQRRFGLAPALAALALWLAAPAPARAQDEGQAATRPPATQRRDEVNHEVQLFLLAATAEGAARGQLPESLGGVVRQLRATLPATGYRVALNVLHRVRDGSNIEFRGVGAPLLSAAAVPGMLPQTAFTYQLGSVRLTEDAAGAKFIHVRSLRFGARVPVQTAAVRGEGGASAPFIQWEDTGLSTEISVREGEPTVVGTITTSRPDELFVLVISAKRTGR